MSNEAYWLGEATRLQGELENLQTQLNGIKQLAKVLFYELEGVIVDTEEGDGFDDVCLNTVKFVQLELSKIK